MNWSAIFNEQRRIRWIITEHDSVPCTSSHGNWLQIHMCVALMTAAGEATGGGYHDVSCISCCNIY